MKHNILMLVGSVILIGCTGESMQALYTSSDVPVTTIALENTEGSLKRIASYTSDNIEDPQGITSISDVAVRPDGDMYIADPNLHRVLQLKANGQVVRSIGHLGTDSQGLRGPSRVEVSSSSLYIYDAALRRFAEYDTSGAFIQNIPVPLDRRVGDMVRTVPGGLVASFATSDGKFGVVRYPGGEETRYLQAEEVSGLDPLKTRATPGMVCENSEDVILTNSLAYQFIRLDSKGLKISGDYRVSSAALSPIDTGNSGGIGQPSALELGLVCDDQRMLYAYIDIKSQAVHFDVHGPSGAVGYRFDISHEATRPLIPVALRDTILVTFRNKPRPRIDFFLLPKTQRGQ